MIGIGYTVGICYGAICLLLSLFLYKLGVPKKYTRKVVHILVGFEWVFLYSFLGGGIHFLAVCLIFTVLLIAAYFGKLMPMISSDDDNSPGTVYYGIAMTGVAVVGCFLPDIMLPFGVAIFCTSIGDGMAGLLGQLISKNNLRIYKNKTLVGTLANLVMSFLSVFVMNLVFPALGLQVWQMLVIALVSTLLELVVGLGLDNIVVTWGITALTYAFMVFPDINNYLAPIILTPLIVIFADSKRALTTGGIVAALIVDLLISVPLGNFGFTLLLSFFVLGVLVDKIKKRHRNTVEDAAEKGACRDYIQVLANGLVPALCALLYFLRGDGIFVVAFCASLAEALADTASSGFGVFAHRTFDPFRMRTCDKGLSGGMSIIGTCAGLVGSFVIAGMALLFGAIDFWMFLIAASAGFLGCIFDSFLGSLFQAKYSCSVCNKLTEKKKHCAEPTVFSSGLALVDNDVVNLLSSLFSAAVALFVCVI